MFFIVCYFFFQAEDGIRGLVRSRGLGDVYKRQVVIVCDTLRGNGKSILAEGAQPSGNASGNAGAGGGGGGGSIALYLQSYSNKLATSGINISVNGGKGGNTSAIFGEGGGGGGGLITTNNLSLIHI